jgi:hypothetical protein
LPIHSSTSTLRTESAKKGVGQSREKKGVCNKQAKKKRRRRAPKREKREHILSAIAAFKTAYVTYLWNGLFCFEGALFASFSASAAALA